MRLKTMPPRIAPAPADGRISTLPMAAVDRKRGRAGIEDRNRIRTRDCGLCQECKRNGHLALGSQVDHIIPLWNGGSDDDENKELLCDACHDAKTTREAAERAGR